VDMIKRLDYMDKMAFEVHKKVFSKMMEGIELSLSQSHVFILKYIRINGSCTVTTLAHHLGITLSAVTSLVDKLCRMELVTRVRSEEDRRVVIIELEEEGERVLSQVNENRKKLFEKLLENLSEEEINTLFNTIDKITEDILESSAK
jgi:DNA-binding MarR family transcriptional regulator